MAWISYSGFSFSKTCIPVMMPAITAITITTATTQIWVIILLYWASSEVLVFKGVLHTIHRAIFCIGSGWVLAVLALEANGEIVRKLGTVGLLGVCFEDIGCLCRAGEGVWSWRFKTRWPIGRINSWKPNINVVIWYSIIISTFEERSSQGGSFGGVVVWIGWQRGRLGLWGGNW